MKSDTKMYSNFIKKNKIVSNKESFTYLDVEKKLQVIPLSKDNGRWYADEEDSCETKKCAIYWYIKNRI